MEQPKKAAFKFEGFKVPRFSYSETGENETELILNFEPSGRFNQKNGSFALTIIFTADVEKPTKHNVVTVECVATFIFDAGTDKNDIPSYFYKNAIAIVFPYIRAFVSTMTLQSNTGLLHLDAMRMDHFEKGLIDNTTTVVQ